MDERFPQLKEEMERIPVPFEKLDLIIEQTINEKFLPKRKKKKRKVFYSLSAAILAFGLFLGSAFVSPTMARVVSQIPLIGSVFSFAGDEGLQTASMKGLSTDINQTVKNKGITLIMKEVYYDGTRLSLGFTQESFLPLGEVERPDIEINGKDINFSSGSSGNFISLQKYAGTINITPTEDLPESFMMKLSFSSVGLVKGKWEFEFPVKLASDVTIVRPMETKIIEGEEVILKTVSSGPAGTALSIDTIKLSNQKDLHLNFNVIDDTGEALTTLSGSGGGNSVNGKEKMEYKFLYTPLKKGVKNVLIIPYVEAETNGLPPKISKSVTEDNLPITLNQGDKGKIVVTDIDYKEDKAVVYFKVESEIPYDFVSNNRLWLESENGKDLTINQKPYAEKVKGNYYKQEFDAISPNENIKIVTRKFPKPIIYDSFNVTLP
ncbi:protein of unknown function [Bacillus sp. OV166]|uniref:DUF4179 domain-containing protein n=1 Tax=Bacillus sp. OV166 TaxID=1882763 RepID=UPI000A2AD7E4|nr:DUF4179 domain-containing protein [Bacillus sp. OV166]SMQ80870.1 protein of unknown function [Bacillus sp. OV166]